MRTSRSTIAARSLVIALVACSRRPSPSEAVPPLPSATAVAPAPAPSAVGSVASSVTARPVPPPPVGGVYLGRTIAQPMSHQGAAWLDRDGRDAVQKPAHVLDVLGLHPGQNVADFGAGSGYFTVPIARRVAPGGKVYAVDIQPEMLALLAKKVDREKLANVVPVLAAPTESRLPRGAIDVVLFVDVYHELARPDRTMAELREVLAPGGRVVWIEYRAEDPKVAIKAEHKTTLAQLEKEAAAVGYTIVKVDESLPEQRIVILAP